MSPSLQRLKRARRAATAILGEEYCSGTLLQETLAVFSSRRLPGRASPKPTKLAKVDTCTARVYAAACGWLAAIHNVQGPVSPYPSGLPDCMILGQDVN